MKVKKRKMTKKFKSLIAFVIIIALIIIIPLSINKYYTIKLRNLNYDKVAAHNIVKKNKEKDVLKTGYNATLNAVFASNDFNIKYYDNYKKISYNNLKDFTKYLNKLIEQGYTNNEVSLIINSADNKALKSFVTLEKQDKVSDLLDFDYAKLANYSRYVDYQKVNRTTEENTVTYVNIGLDKPFYTDYLTIKKFSLNMLTNKYRGLDQNYVPDDLVKLNTAYTLDNEDEYLNSQVAEVFYQMAEDMAKENLSIVANSAYRSYKNQQETYDLYLKTYGENYVKNYVGNPGFSEHQTGLALDIASKNGDVFANTKESKWLKENAYKYGFILRYPQDKEDITGYKYEPWHYRYVGTEIAQYIHNNSLTFDEYYIRFLDK